MRAPSVLASSTAVVVMEATLLAAPWQSNALNQLERPQKGKGAGHF